VNGRHALEIVKPGRGTWMAGCSCGHAYTYGEKKNRYWAPSEVSTAKIRALHAEHKKDHTL
jgi:hypothetical protein